MGPKKQAKKEVVQEPPKVDEPPPIPPHELQGVGRFEYSNGIFYEGEWRLFNHIKVKHGKGELIIPGTSTKLGGQRYKGQWKQDSMEGQGRYEYASGAVYTGEWHRNLHHGTGTYQFPDGSVYQGEWRHHQPHGEGVYTDVKNIRWNGEYSEGCYESKLQQQLREKRLMKIKEQKYLNQSFEWFSKLQTAFAKSDKKTFKENMSPLFAVQQEIKALVKDPYPKFEDRPPEKWYSKPLKYE